MSHTPTPWKTGTKHPCRIIMQPPPGQADYAHDVIIGTTCAYDDEGAESEQEQADATFIVQCVNQYDHLIQALEYCARGPEELRPTNQAQYLVARAALAVAQKGRP